MERGLSMSLLHEQSMSIQEFHKLREGTERLFEYADGNVMMVPSPSTQHQRISSRLHAKLFNFLDGGDCEVFHAPYDVELKGGKLSGTHIVIPDLLVICDKHGLTNNKYIGAPELIIEILSPSNQAHDLVFKLNLYMQAGVNEYWIVNPMLQIIQVYELDKDGQYKQVDSLKGTGTIRSTVLHEFQVNLEDIF